MPINNTMQTLYLFLQMHRRVIFVILLCVYFFGLCIPISHAEIVFDQVTGMFKETDPNKPGLSDIIGWGADKLFHPFAWIFYKLATGVGGLISGLGALMLDISIQFTVIEMGTILGPNSELGKTIQSLWKVVRDIINILFIFGFIYIGIKTILDSQKSETRRTLGYLIIAALMINFSLYITEVVIDFSNIAATQVYQQVVSGGLASGAVANTNNPMAVGAQSLAGAFWDVAGVSSFFGGEGMPPDLDSGQVIVYSIFMMIFLIIAGSIFFMGALLLIKRFIALTLYLIFSPAMFIGWIFPAFSSKQESWREGFINQAFVAPVFLFMLYLSLTLLQKLRLASGFTGTDFTGLVKGGQMEAGHISVVLFFCMMIGFLYASIQVSEKMSKAGASSMLSFLDTGRSWAHKKFGDATLGTVARLGRATGGFAGEKLAKSERVTSRLGQRGFGGMLARGAFAGGNYAADANFDARSVAGFGGTLGLGAGKKGGRKTRQEELDKKEKAKANSFGEIDDEDERVKELVEAEHHFEDDLAQLKREREDASKEDKPAYDDLIKQKQEQIEEQKKAILREKNRRQIGAYADPALEESTTVAYAEAREKHEAAAKSIKNDIINISAQKEALADFVKAKNANAASAVAEIEREAANAVDEQELIAADNSRSDVERAAARTQIATVKSSARTRIADIKSQTNTAIMEEENGVKISMEVARESIKESRVVLNTQNKAIKELRKEAQKNASDQGYAGVLEKSGFIGSSIFGRTRGQDRTAGKSVRKQFEKGRLKEEAHAHDDSSHAPAAAAHAPAAGGGAAHGGGGHHP